MGQCTPPPPPQLLDMGYFTTHRKPFSVGNFYILKARCSGDLYRTSWSRMFGGFSILHPDVRGFFKPHLESRMFEIYFILHPESRMFGESLFYILKAGCSGGFFYYVYILKAGCSGTVHITSWDTDVRGFFIPHPESRMFGGYFKLHPDSRMFVRFFVLHSESRMFGDSLYYTWKPDVREVPCIFPSCYSL